MHSENHACSARPAKAVNDRTMKRRRVSFAPRIRVKHTVHLSEYTPTEVESTWYSLDETKHMKQGILLTICQMRKASKGCDKRSPETTCCIRGLEQMLTTRSVEERRARKKGVLEAVIREQRRQRAEGFHSMSDAFIAEASVTARAMALRSAAGDAAVTAKATMGSINKQLGDFSLSGLMEQRLITSNITVNDCTVTADDLSKAPARKLVGSNFMKIFLNLESELLSECHAAPLMYAAEGA